MQLLLWDVLQARERHPHKTPQETNVDFANSSREKRILIWCQYFSSSFFQVGQCGIKFSISRRIDLWSMINLREYTAVHCKLNSQRGSWKKSIIRPANHTKSIFDHFCPKIRPIFWSFLVLTLVLVCFLAVFYATLRFSCPILIQFPSFFGPFPTKHIMHCAKIIGQDKKF